MPFTASTNLKDWVPSLGFSVLVLARKSLRHICNCADHHWDIRTGNGMARVTIREWMIEPITCDDLWPANRWEILNHFHTWNAEFTEIQSTQFGLQIPTVKYNMQAWNVVFFCIHTLQNLPPPSFASIPTLRGFQIVWKFCSNFRSYLQGWSRNTSFLEWCKYFRSNY